MMTLKVEYKVQQYDVEYMTVWQQWDHRSSYCN